MRPLTTSNNSWLIVVHKLSKAYQMGDTVVSALSSIDLKVKKGEFLALMGPSGSGKSTLLHLLGCLDQPTSGTYVLEGRNVSELPDEALASLRSTRVGFIFQTFNLLPAYTALENVSLPLLYQSDAGDIKLRSLKALELVGLSHRVNHLPGEMSGGERQRVAIARALVTRPAIILADEPTGNLDSRTGSEIMKLLESVHKQGVTLVVVTHDAGIAAHAGRVLYMHDGKIIQEENCNEQS